MRMTSDRSPTIVHATPAPTTLLRISHFFLKPKRCLARHSPLFIICISLSIWLNKCVRLFSTIRLKRLRRIFFVGIKSINLTGSVHSSHSSERTLRVLRSCPAASHLLIRHRLERRVHQNVRTFLTGTVHLLDNSEIISKGLAGASCSRIL